MITSFSMRKMATAVLFCALLMFLDNLRAQSTVTKGFCAHEVGNVPVAIFGGVFWLPIGYVVSSKVNNDEISFIAGNWICGVPINRDYFIFSAGKIIIGKRSACEGCNVSEIDASRMRLVRSRYLNGVTVNELDVGDGNNPFSIVFIYDDKNYIQIIGDDTRFWESSLRSMFEDSEYINNIIARDALNNPQN